MPTPPLSKATIYVLDSGVDLNHPDLADRALEPQTDFTEDGSPLADPIGRGTHAAGIATGACPGCGLVSYRVIDRYGRVDPLTVTEAIMKAMERAGQNPDERAILNLGFEDSDDSPTLERAIESAVQSGMVAVAAAGDENGSTPRFPASYPGVISVAATNESDSRWMESSTSAAGSNYASWVTIAAPGANIRSTIPQYETDFSDLAGGTGYGTFSGTAEATAFASGLVGLMRMRSPAMTSSEISQALVENGDAIAGSLDWPSPKRINALKTLQAVNRNLSVALTMSAVDESGTLANVNVSVSSSDIDQKTGGSVPFSLHYFKNATVTLTADATLSAGTASYNFAGWKIDGETRSDNPITLTLTADAQVIATYAKTSPVPVIANWKGETLEDKPLAVPLPLKWNGKPLTYHFATEEEPKNGQFDLATFIYTPNADFNGQDNFSVYATDDASPPNASAPATFSIQVDPVNDPPHFGADPTSVSGKEGGAINFALTASDVDSPTLTYSSTNLPEGATLNAHTGEFAWTPSSGQAGSYSILFIVSDGEFTDFITVAVTVAANHPPVLLVPLSEVVNQGEALRFTVTASDLDGDTLKLSATDLPSKSAFDPSTGAFSWTPIAGQDGIFTLTFAASDGIATSSQTMKIRVNAPPAIAKIDKRAIFVGQKISFVVSATDSDGDPVSLSVKNAPNGAGFDPATGVFTWTPSSNQVGVYDITVNASDGEITSTQIFTIVVIASGLSEQLLNLSVTPSNVNPGDQVKVCVDDLPQIDPNAAYPAAWVLTFAYPIGWTVADASLNTPFTKSVISSDMLLSFNDTIPGQLIVGLVGGANAPGSGSLGCFNLLAGPNAQSGLVKITSANASYADGNAAMVGPANPVLVTVRGAPGVVTKDSLTVTATPSAVRPGDTTEICVDSNVDLSGTSIWRLIFQYPSGWSVVKPYAEPFAKGDLTDGMLTATDTSLSGMLYVALVGSINVKKTGSLGCFSLLAGSDARSGAIRLHISTQRMSYSFDDAEALIGDATVTVQSATP